MEIQRLSVDTEKILGEIISAQNPTQFLCECFENLSSEDDENLRSIIQELCQAGYIAVPMWANNKPYHVRVKSIAHMYGTQFDVDRSTDNDTPGGKDMIDKKKVFIVHGHNELIRDSVELFLHRLGLEPIILANEANGGSTIIDKFTSNADVSFAIILYTACDEGRSKEENDLKSRARQNVIFEHGYFYAKLGCRNVVALHEPRVEIPSDLSGVLYISLASDWKSELKKEMKAAGIEADWTRG